MRLLQCHNPLHCAAYHSSTSSAAYAFTFFQFDNSIHEPTGVLKIEAAARSYRAGRQLLLRSC